MGSGWKAATACAVLAVSSLVGPHAAHAAPLPVITSGPTIAGTPQVGNVLTASATWKNEPNLTVEWQWQRCKSGCERIAGATTNSYRVAVADAGAALRVGLRLTNKAGSVQKFSDPTVVVVVPAPSPTPAPTATPAPAPSATPAPAPTATPAPAPTAAPTPAPTAVPVATAAPTAAPRPVATTRARIPLLHPFPVVRIRGVLTTAGARLTLFSVRAPRAARVVVVCRGRGCPLRRLAQPAGAARVRAFERPLRAGTRLEVSVTRAGYVGKFTVIVIRRGAAPWRSDRCLRPGSRRPVRCTAT